MEMKTLTKMKDHLLPHPVRIPPPPFQGWRERGVLEGVPEKAGNFTEILLHILAGGHVFTQRQNFPLFRGLKARPHLLPSSRLAPKTQSQWQGQGNAKDSTEQTVRER